MAGGQHEQHIISSPDMINRIISIKSMDLDPNLGRNSSGDSAANFKSMEHLKVNQNHI